MTTFAPFKIRKPLGVIRGLLALICVCDNFHHAEPTLSLARPYVNRWPARLDTGSLEHELEFNSAQRNSRAQPLSLALMASGSASYSAMKRNYRPPLASLCDNVLVPELGRYAKPVYVLLDQTPLV